MLTANPTRRPEIMKNDLQIQHEVLSELEHDDDIPAGAIGVEVHHGVVKLAGRIGDPATKRRAELDARRVAGVTNVVLDLEVETR
jgi:osmotically-inducible protein OsmY